MRGDPLGTAKTRTRTSMTKVGGMLDPDRSYV